MVLVGMKTTLSRQSIQIIANTCELETKQETEIKRPINIDFCLQKSVPQARFCCEKNLLQAKLMKENAPQAR